MSEQHLVTIKTDYGIMHEGPAETCSICRPKQDQTQEPNRHAWNEADKKTTAPLDLEAIKARGDRLGFYNLPVADIRALVAEVERLRVVTELDMVEILSRNELLAAKDAEIASLKAEIPKAKTEWIRQVLRHSHPDVIAAVNALLEGSNDALWQTLDREKAKDEEIFELRAENKSLVADNMRLIVRSPEGRLETRIRDLEYLYRLANQQIHNCPDQPWHTAFAEQQLEDFKASLHPEAAP